MEMANRERRVVFLQELSPRGTLKLSDKTVLKDLSQSPCSDLSTHFPTGGSVSAAVHYHKA